MLGRRKGDTRPDVVHIQGILDAYGKAEADISDVIFQLKFGNKKILEKKLSLSEITLDTSDTSNIKVNILWQSSDFDNLDVKKYNLAIGVLFVGDSIDQTPDNYVKVDINNKEKNLGENPEYEIQRNGTL